MDVKNTLGEVSEFDPERITTSLMHEALLDEKTAREITAEIAGNGLKRLKFVSGPLIRELVCAELTHRGLEEERKRYTRVGLPMQDVYDIIRQNHESSHENANLQANPETVNKLVADKLFREAALLAMNPILANAHLTGQIHIGDLEFFETRPFCLDHDLRFFFKYGFMADGTGKHTSVAGPAQRAEVAILHAVKILSSSQTNCAGGQGFMEFNMFMAPYIESEKQAEQLAQMLLYELTQMYCARGGQVVFSSLQLPMGVAKTWQDVPVVARGEMSNHETYGDYEDETRMFFRAIIKQMIKGDYYGKPFLFPKPEIQITPEFLHSSYAEEWDLIGELTAKSGIPYFDNVIPEYRGGGEGVSCMQCCAYSFCSMEGHKDHEKKLMFEDGHHFSMGGYQVTTINLPQAAYRSGGDEAKFTEEVNIAFDLAKEVSRAKHDTVQRQLDSGALPFLSQRFGDSPPLLDFEAQGAAIGVVGLNEAVQYMSGQQMHESDSALAFGVRAIEDLKAHKLETQDDLLISISRTPAESLAGRLAKIDRKLYPNEAISRGTEAAPYYTNGCMLAIDAPVPLYERFRAEIPFFPILNGGNIMHIFLGEAAPSPEGILKMVANLARTECGYFAFTRNFTVCYDCHHMFGGLSQTKCPKCGGSDLTGYSRVTGYLQQVDIMNPAKQQEIADRHEYDI